MYRYTVGYSHISIHTSICTHIYACLYRSVCVKIYLFINIHVLYRTSNFHRFFTTRVAALTFGPSPERDESSRKKLRKNKCTTRSARSPNPYSSYMLEKRKRERERQGKFDFRWQLLASGIILIKLICFFISHITHNTNIFRWTFIYSPMETGFRWRQDKRNCTLLCSN